MDKEMTLDPILRIEEAFEESGLHFGEKWFFPIEDISMDCCCSSMECCDSFVVREEVLDECQLNLHPEPKRKAVLSPEVEEKITMIMNLLEKEGIPPEMVRSWLDSHVCLSRLTVTARNKIILNDFNDLEIKMLPLPKTLFFFYLRHPEGVDFFCLQDYRKELMDIYGHLTKCDDLMKMEERIQRLIDPWENGINEKCSAIKKAFTDKLDEAVARNYYVVGQQGDKKRILLDRSLVTWNGF